MFVNKLPQYQNSYNELKQLRNPQDVDGFLKMYLKYKINIADNLTYCKFVITNSSHVLYTHSLET